jgi:hypothetical protein
MESNKRIFNSKIKKNYLDLNENKNTKLDLPDINKKIDNSQSIVYLKNDIVNLKKV